MSIRNLYFGKDDAETDFTGSGLLRDSFLKTDVYNLIKAGRKSLVIGRKGSGKSAICLMLNRQLCKEGASCIVTPDAISADEIRRFELVGINEQQSKKLVWRYVLLTQICKFLLCVSRQEWGQESSWPDEVKKVRQFLVDNREVDDLNIQEKFWKIIGKLSTTLTLGAFGQSFEITAQDQIIPGLQLGEQLDFLEGKLKSQISQLNDKSLYILIDKVDEIWDDDLSSCHMVVGLLMAVKDINTKFENVRCIIFLRSDIYERLQFFDKDKQHGDEEPILWTQETLPELILARARISTTEHQMSLDEFWSAYFPSIIKGIPASKFILSHTLMRPRDAIQLCNLCTDLARRENINVISEDCVLKALDVYSSWKLNDLIGEYRVNYPFLNDLLILFSNASYVIPRKRLKSIYDRVEAILKDRYPDYIPSLSLDSILNILYGVGFIGIERNRNTSYYYETPGTVEDSDKFFVIHPAFRYALKSTSSVDIQPYHSDSDVRQQSRYLSEISRRRSPTRFELERPRSSSKELSRWIRRFNKLLVSLKEVRELPSEVLSEIGQELSEIASEFEMLMDSKRVDIAQLQLTIVRTNRYLLDLRKNLESNGYISPKAKVVYQIQEIIDMSEEIREIFYYDW